MMTAAKTHLVTLAGRDSSSAHRKFVVRGGEGSVAKQEDAELFTEADAEDLANKLAVRSGMVAWVAELASDVLPDW